MLTTSAGFIFSVGLLIYLTVRWHWPAFLALLMASYAAGLSFGFAPGLITSMVKEGFGNTLGDIGLTIALGALLGCIMEYSGATISIARGVIGLLGGRFPGIALAITGYIVSIPIYCDSGFIILNSIRKHLSHTHNVSPVFLSTVLGVSLYATHTLVPPTPGPLAAVSNLHLAGALPIVLFTGLVFSILAVSAGFLWALYMQRFQPECSEHSRVENFAENSDEIHFFVALIPILMPMLLITVGGLAGQFQGWGGELLSFLGEPINALLAGLGCCWPIIRKLPRDQLRGGGVSKGLEAGGKIALVVGCGGAFGLVLRNSDLANLITTNSGLINLGLCLPFLIAAIIKTAEGSATVALITSSALIEPLLPALGLDSTMGRVLTLFACGGGAMTIAHVNDSFFWVIAEFTGMDTLTALKSVTVATFFQGMVVLMAVQVLAVLFSI